MDLIIPKPKTKKADQIPVLRCDLCICFFQATVLSASTLNNLWFLSVKQLQSLPSPLFSHLATTSSSFSIHFSFPFLPDFLAVLHSHYILFASGLMHFPFWVYNGLPQHCPMIPHCHFLLIQVCRLCGTDSLILWYMFLVLWYNFIFNIDY